MCIENKLAHKNNEIDGGGKGLKFIYYIHSFFFCENKTKRMEMSILLCPFGLYIGFGKWKRKHWGFCTRVCNLMELYLFSLRLVYTMVVPPKSWFFIYFFHVDFRLEKIDIGDWTTLSPKRSVSTIRIKLYYSC